MKKVIRITAAVFATIALVGFVNFTQAAAPVKVAKKDVPEAVLSSFTKMYPQATVITYSREIREGKTCYELESKDGTTKRDIIYAANGDVMEIEEAMKASELPATVMGTLIKNYPKVKIIAAEKLVKGTIVQYETTIKVKGKMIDLVFGETGELVKSVTK